MQSQSALNARSEKIRKGDEKTMNAKAIWGILGFTGGAMAGGYFVGMHCAKKHREVVEALQDEIDQLIDERVKMAEKGLLEAQKGILEGQSNTRSDTEEDEGEEDDFEADFDDPFSDSEVKQIIVTDGRNSENKLIFNSVDELKKYLSFSGDTEDIFEGIDRNNYSAYAALSHQYKSDEFDEHFAERDHPHDSGEGDEDPDDIYLISKDQFQREVKYRADETITYYQQDGVLVNSVDQVIRDQEEVIGKEAMEKAESTEQDFLYVSNDVEDKIYEIVVEHMYSYRDMVGGGAGV